MDTPIVRPLEISATTLAAWLIRPVSVFLARRRFSVNVEGELHFLAALPEPLYYVLAKDGTGCVQFHAADVASIDEVDGKKLHITLDAGRIARVLRQRTQGDGQ